MSGAHAVVLHWRRSWPIVVLVILLAYHFVARNYHAQNLPLADHHNYERSYGYALSLMADWGFEDIALAATPAARPVYEFLQLQRPRLTAEEWSDYVAEPPTPDQDSTYGVYRSLATTRTLDLRLTAWLWQLFGIRWDILFAFYSLVSVAVAGCVYALTKRLTNSAVAGLLACGLFTFSPLASHLSAWSIRDVSPMWFTAFAFTYLYCVVDRWSGSRWWLLHCAVLGVLLVIGIGWRPDTLLLIPCVGGAFIAQCFVWRKGWRSAVAGLALVAGGIIGGQQLVNALTPAGPMPASMGFHMSYYADFSRCNLWGVENTFQVQRCDMQTLFDARNFVANGDEDQRLVYMSAEYGAVCRDMTLRLLRYHAYDLVVHVPSALWKCLNGLQIPEAASTYDVWQQTEFRPPLTRWLCRYVCEPVVWLSPALFLLGWLVFSAAGPMRLPSFIIGSFALLYVVVLLIVLPEQKHLGPLLLAQYVLAGAGLWAGGQLLRRASRTAVANYFRDRQWIRPAWIFGSLFLIWGLVTGGAFLWSRQERTQLLHEIEQCAAAAVDAPEFLRGENAFVAHFPPGTKDDRCGFLLTIVGGNQPATLECRHHRSPNDWGWPRQWTTRHVVHPHVTQTFFVTCLQGSEYGDPRPYTCFASLLGPGRMTECRRVDLRQWRHLPVSTLFYPGQLLADRIHGMLPTAYSSPNSHVFPELTLDQVERSKTEFRVHRHERTNPTSTQPVAHLAFLDGTTGQWVVADSDGWKFEARGVNYWAPQPTFQHLGTGDFNGDGICDLLCGDGQSRWWQARGDGALLAYATCRAWVPDGAVQGVVTGDFNGDGLDDVLAIQPEVRAWHVGLSDGQDFVPATWGEHPPLAADAQVLTADVNGDGRTDVVVFQPATGQWDAYLSDGHKFQPPVTISSGAATKLGLLLRDRESQPVRFAAYEAAERVWRVRAIDNRAAVPDSPAWPKNFTCAAAQCGSFSAADAAGIVTLDDTAQRLCLAELRDGQWSEPVVSPLPRAALGWWVADFNGDGRDDIAIQTTTTGELWVGFWQDGRFGFQRWGDLQHPHELVAGRVLTFWPLPDQVKQRAAALRTARESASQHQSDEPGKSTR